MVTHVHATESLWLRLPQLSIRFEASATPHPPGSLQIAPESTFIEKTLPPQKLRCLKSSQSNLQLQLWRLYTSRVICSPRLSISLQKFPVTATNKSTCSYVSPFPFSSAFIMCNAAQCGQLWTMARFPACNSNSPTPIITTVITNPFVKIVQLQRSHPHHPPPCQQLQIDIFI